MSAPPPIRPSPLPGALGLAAAALLLAAGARGALADTFVLKGGGSIHGTLDETYQDAQRRKWLRVGTAFGSVAIQSRHLKTRLKSKVSDGPLRLKEMRISTLSGEAHRSSDDGKTWLRLRMPGGEDTVDEKRWPELAPGDRVRTGGNGHVEIDIGVGYVVVDSGSELEFAASSAATLRLLQGRMGTEVDRRTDGSELRVETPVAVMGVRGTRFLVRADEGAYVAVEQGAVAVASESIAAGEALSVGSDGTTARSGITSDDAEFLRRLSRGRRFPRIAWVAVPAGSFEMGGPVVSGQRPGTPLATPVHEVDVPAFLMSATEVSRADLMLYVAWVERAGDFAATWPAGVKPRRTFKDSQPRPERVTERVPEEPATGSWYLASSYCFWLGGTLPSEAQWEYAARAGTKGEYWCGPSKQDLARCEWSLHSCGETPVKVATKIADMDAMREVIRTHRLGPRPVGTSVANPFGLYDMLGNQAEWCQDAATDDYTSAPADGSAVRGPPTANRVSRGGQWCEDGYYEAHFRRALGPTQNAFTWRVVRPIPE